jgi:hypothetical protein
MSRSDGKYDNSWWCTRFRVAGISFSPSDVAASVEMTTSVLTRSAPKATPLESRVIDGVASMPRNQQTKKNESISSFQLHRMQEDPQCQWLP